jgi:hypothetical protein
MDLDYAILFEYSRALAFCRNDALLRASERMLTALILEYQKSVSQHTLTRLAITWAYYP